MDIASLLVALALLLLVAAFVFRPLLFATRDEAGEREREPAAAHAQSELEMFVARREGVVSALLDLDFDHATGKIDDADYAAQRPALIADGVAILKQLDARGVGDEMGLHGAASTELEQRIEQAVARRRTTPAHTPLAAFCPQCGAAAHPGDRFCSKCGRSFASVAEALE